MFGIGTSELMIILAVGLIVIGPQKLPDLAKAIGRAVGEFRKATSEIKETLEGDENLASVKQTFEDAMQEGMKAGLTHEEEQEDLDNEPYSVAEDSGNESVAEDGTGAEDQESESAQPDKEKNQDQEEPGEDPALEQTQAGQETEPETTPAEEHGPDRKSDA